MPLGQGQSKQNKSKSTRSTKSQDATKQDAIKLLKSDHDEVEELFAQYEKQKNKNGGTKGDLIDKICTALTVHAQIEEEIFYPAVREAFPKLSALLEEANVEHGSAKDLIAQIEEGDAEDEHFDAMVTVLGEYIKHHVREEQNELFPQISDTKVDLQELGERLEARKH